jgi:hypothetical protein
MMGLVPKTDEAIKDKEWKRPASGRPPVPGSPYGMTSSQPSRRKPRPKKRSKRSSGDEYSGNHTLACERRRGSRQPISKGARRFDISPDHGAEAKPPLERTVAEINAMSDDFPGLRQRLRWRGRTQRDDRSDRGQ